MDILQTHVDRQREFGENRRHFEGLVAEMRERLAAARAGGGPRYLARHLEQGKLPVRERIERLLDPASPFLELSPLAAWGCTRTRRRAPAWSPGSAGCPAGK